MTTPTANAVRDLPQPLTRVLEEVVGEASRALGSSLRSVVLFGSAAENRLRPTSDVNLLVVITAFDPSKVAHLVGVLQRAHAAVRLRVMWLTAEEVAYAGESFAVKFADIVRRHRVIFGEDVLAGLKISRQAAVIRLRQVFLNLVVRLRATYVLDLDHEERLVLVIADVIGPLRAGAAELMELEGRPAPSARDALERLATEWSPQHVATLLTAIRTARETRRLEPGQAAAVVVQVIDLAGFLHRRASALT